MKKSGGLWRRAQKLACPSITCSLTFRSQEALSNFLQFFHIFVALTAWLMLLEYQMAEASTGGQELPVPQATVSGEMR